MTIEGLIMTDADQQAIDFFIKRAEYSAGLAAQHCRDSEFEKGVNLYKQAYAYYLKAQQAKPDDAPLKAKIEEIKQKYQEAKKSMET